MAAAAAEVNTSVAGAAAHTSTVDTQLLALVAAASNADVGSITHINERKSPVATVHPVQQVSPLTSSPAHPRSGGGSGHSMYVPSHFDAPLDSSWRSAVSEADVQSGDSPHRLSPYGIHNLLYRMISVDAFSRMMEVIDLCALEMNFLRYYPSALAASVLLLLIPELAHTRIITDSASAPGGAAASKGTASPAPTPAPRPMASAAGATASPAPNSVAGRAYMRVTPTTNIRISGAAGSGGSCRSVPTAMDLKSGGGNSATAPNRGTRSSRGGRFRHSNTSDRMQFASPSGDDTASRSMLMSPADTAAPAAPASSQESNSAAAAAPPQQHSFIWRISGYTVEQLSPVLSVMRHLLECPPKPLESSQPNSNVLSPTQNHPAPYFDSKVPIEDVYTRQTHNPNALSFLAGLESRLAAARVACDTPPPLEKPTPQRIPQRRA